MMSPAATGIVRANTMTNWGTVMAVTTIAPTRVAIEPTAVGNTCCIVSSRFSTSRMILVCMIEAFCRLW